MCQQHKSWMCISFTLAMDSREWRRQAVPGRLPRDVPRDGLGTRGCNGTMVLWEQQSTWLLHEDLACPVLAGEGGHISSLWYSSLLPWRMWALLPLVEALKKNSLCLGKAQTAAVSAHPPASSHAGCGSGSLPSNSQTQKSLSCIASGCRPALVLLFPRGLQALTGLWPEQDWSHKEWDLLNSAFHTKSSCRSEWGWIQMDMINAPGHEGRSHVHTEALRPALSCCYKP